LHPLPPKARPRRVCRPRIQISAVSAAASRRRSECSECTR
jgi:hypothetical protein